MSHTNILLESGTNELEIVEFYLEEVRDDNSPRLHYYGINVAKVLEIIRMPDVTEMPEATHESVSGVFDLRSKVIPLIDWGKWLGKELIQTESPKVIVTEFNQLVSAFSVTGVTRIHRINWEQVEAPDVNVSALASNAITGVVKFEDRIVFILDLEKIVAELNPDLALKLDENVVWDTGGNYRALVADDSTLIREMIRDLLMKAGFSVETANNGRQCWKRLEEIRHQAKSETRPVTDFVQVVVSDIEMPMMDGHNLTKRIKDDLDLRELPVILFSSLITDSLRHKGEKVGADAQISKPEITNLARTCVEMIKVNEQKAKIAKKRNRNI